MTVNVELSGAVSVRLSAEAARRGVGIDQVIADLAQLLPPGDPSRSSSPKLAFIAAGESKTGITGRIDEWLADEHGRDRYARSAGIRALSRAERAPGSIAAF